MSKRVLTISLLLAIQICGISSDASVEVIYPQHSDVMQQSLGALLGIKNGEPGEKGKTKNAFPFKGQTRKPSISQLKPKPGPRPKPTRPAPAPKPPSPTTPAPTSTAPASLLQLTTNWKVYTGLGNGDYGFIVGAAPPDTVGAVGTTQYVQWVNNAFAIFNKNTGNLIAGPTSGNVIWSGFGGNCAARNSGDPVVLFDKLANRWVLGQMQADVQPYQICFAVSTSNDATGTYTRYAFAYGSDSPDYPKFGVWPDAYYATYNIFSNGASFTGPKVCAFDRIKMLQGDLSATQQCITLSSNYYSLLPADLDGTNPPPTGSPFYLMNLDSNIVNLWTSRVNFSTNSFTLSGPNSIAVSAFSYPCGGGNCVPQPGTSNLLDSVGDRLMFRLTYRNRNGVESLLATHSVSVNGITSVRWYEFRISAGAVSKYQDGTLGTSDNIHRWMGSIASDKVGNIAVGYSESSSSVYPSIAISGRLVSNSTNSMLSEYVVQRGSGSQTGSLHRWGDYSSMTIDPTDDCTFWYTTEYLKTTGSFNWNTKIISFKFQSCS